MLAGGPEQDIYGAATGATGRAVIFGFESGDKIDVSTFGITSFDELTLDPQAEMLLSITIDGFEFSIRGKGALSYTASDFIFAEPLRLDFDDVAFEDDFLGEVPDDYFGFTWTNFFIEETDESTTAINGFNPSSGDNLVFNGRGNDASIAREDAFDLESAVMGAGWNDGLEITIRGFLDGFATGVQTVVIEDATQSQVVAFDDAIFDRVDRVEFSSGGGTINDGFSGGAGSQFWMDDLLLV